MPYSPHPSMFKPFNKKDARPKRKPKPRLKIKKKDPIWIDGVRPRPMFVDYKDVELLKKLVRPAAVRPVSTPFRSPSSGPGTWACCRTWGSSSIAALFIW